MPAKGPLQSVQVFGRKVRPGRRGPLRLLAVELDWALWPYALGVPWPQLGGSGAGFSLRPSAGRVRGRAQRWGGLLGSPRVPLGRAVSPGPRGNWGRDLLS